MRKSEVGAIKEPLKIDKNEVLRYLGRKEQAVDAAIMKMLDLCTNEIYQAARPRYVYSIFDIVPSLRGEDGTCFVDVKETSLHLTGKDIYRHLSGCEKCAVMGVTLGVEVDNAIRIAQSTDMFKAVILDSCATTYIEAVCDEVENMIVSEANENGYETNFRFSPGYGDLPITTQRELLNVIDAARKIGLTVTESSLMIPGKSVTAIIGFTDSDFVQERGNKCEICSMRDNCMFRKDGITCGHN